MKNLVIYTDGSCLGNNDKSIQSRGGWAAIVLEQVDETITSQETNSGKCTDKDVTNNRMELTAAIKGLEMAFKRDLTQFDNVILLTDSKYVQSGVESYLDAWIKRGYSNVKNPDLWKQLVSLNNQVKAKFVWVKAHNGSKYNEMADKLALKEAQSC